LHEARTEGESAQQTQNKPFISTREKEAGQHNKYQDGVQFIREKYLL
jgi:hypothetical protein